MLLLLYDNKWTLWHNRTKLRWETQDYLFWPTSEYQNCHLKGLKNPKGILCFTTLVIVVVLAAKGDIKIRVAKNIINSVNYPNFGLL